MNRTITLRGLDIGDGTKRVSSGHLTVPLSIKPSHVVAVHGKTGATGQTAVMNYLQTNYVKSASRTTRFVLDFIKYCNGEDAGSSESTNDAPEGLGDASFNDWCLFDNAKKFVLERMFLTPISRNGAQGKMYTVALKKINGIGKKFYLEGKKPNTKTDLDLLKNMKHMYP